MRYIDTDLSKDKPGALARLFGSQAEEPNARYRIVIANAGEKADVTIQTGKQGDTVANPATAKRMLTLIQGKLGP